MLLCIGLSSNFKQENYRKAEAVVDYPLILNDVIPDRKQMI